MWSWCSSDRHGSCHRQAAADRQRLARDEAGAVGGEEGDGRADVFGGAEPPHRNRTGHPGDDLLRVAGPCCEAPQGRRVGGAGAHRVGGDALGSHLAGQGLSERDDAALRAGVHRLQGRAHPAGVRPYVDDTPEAAVHHARHDSLDDSQRALEVDVEDLVQNSSVVCTNGMKSSQPALFTTTSTGPSAASTARTADSTAAVRVTSISTAIAVPPAAVISLAVCSAALRFRSATATLNPSAASAAAMPLPMPWA